MTSCRLVFWLVLAAVWIARSKQAKSCDDGWTMYDKNCYLASQMRSLDWYSARQDCLSKNADLVSIHSRKEMNFLMTLVKDGYGSKYWIGYNEVKTGTYKWSDSSPKDYRNFAMGEPNDVNGEEKCVSMYRQNGKWNDDPCYRRSGYICKAKKDKAAAPTSPTDIEGKCPQNFLSEAHSKKCFYFRSDKRSWTDANKACKKLNAELVSISSSIENAFLTLLNEQTVADDIWIGMTRKKSQWKWSDDSNISFTNWGTKRYKDSFKWTNCASMRRFAQSIIDIGTWDGASCYESKPYICQAQREHGSGSDPRPFESQYGTDKCGQDAFLFHGRCYQFYEVEKTWDEARSFCQSKQANLATNVDTLERFRMTYESYKYDEHQQFWIDVKFNADLGEYVWGNDYEVKTTYWDFDQPDESHEKSCVTSLDGYWYDESCSTKKPFFCVGPKEGYDEFIPPAPSHSDHNCGSPDMKSSGNKCFWVPSTLTATWADARGICLARGMTLASIHTRSENDFVREMLRQQRKQEKTAWIGLEKGATGSFRWSDDSPTNLLLWASGEPSDLGSGSHIEDCVEMKYQDTYGNWNDVTCDQQMPFVCSVEAINCGNGWRLFEGACYTNGKYFESLDWYSAREKCLNMSADLVSIHSKKENDFLIQLADDGWNSQYWTGYHQLGLESYAWSDASSTSFKNFGKDEPDDANGAKKCVVLQEFSGAWYSKRCSYNLGYICKKQEGTAPPPTLPTEVEGRCPGNFKSEVHSNKCYYFSGDENKKSWEEAHAACKEVNPRAELASIEGPVDQAFITLLTEDSSQINVWIGLNARENGKDWTWIDNSVTSYTNWGSGQPLAYMSVRFSTECAAMKLYADVFHDVGTWWCTPCSEEKPYVCQALREPGGGVEPYVFEEQFGTAQCGKEDFLYRDRCYRFYNIEKTWDEARQFCQDRDTDLALTFDTYEGARLNYESYSKGDHQQFWIDVRLKMESYEYVWGTKYQVQVAVWDAKEPNLPLNDSCVTSSDGYWYDEPCMEKKRFFCVGPKGAYDEFIPPKPDPEDGKLCRRSSHTQFGNKCYLIPNFRTNWPEAKRYCNLYHRMTLASIHKKDEIDFLVSLVNKTAKDATQIWIGFEKGPGGSFRWSDGSPTNFLYWESSTFSRSNECAAMMLDKDGKWNGVDCQLEMAFVCTVKADLKPTPIGGPVNIDSKGYTQIVKKEKVTEAPLPVFGDDDEYFGDTDQGKEVDAGLKDDDDRGRGNPGVGDHKVGGPVSRKAHKSGADHGSGGLSGGAITGIVLAVLVLAGLAVVAFLFVQRRRPLWLQKSILRGDNSSGKTTFDNALYKQEEERESDIHHVTPNSSNA